MTSKFGTFVDTGDWCGRVIVRTHTCVVYFNGQEETVSLSRLGEHGQYWDTTPEREKALWNKDKEQKWLEFIALTYSSERHNIDTSLLSKFSFYESTYEEVADKILGYT